MVKIGDMSPREICKYLNEGNHDMPIIMKHCYGYDVCYSVTIGGHRKYKKKENLTFTEAIGLFTKLFAQQKDGE